MVDGREMGRESQGIYPLASLLQGCLGWPCSLTAAPLQAALSPSLIPPSHSVLPFPHALPTLCKESSVNLSSGPPDLGVLCD